MKRPHFWTSFSRAQIASILATLVDFGLLVLLVEKAGLWYVLATSMGAAAGAATNFSINRYWSFEAGEAPWRKQAARYAAVSAGSLLLNTAGVYALTDGFGSPYPISKLVTALVVGWVFNYPLHRGFVFSSPSSQ